MPGWPGDEVLVRHGAGPEEAQVSGRAVVGTLALLPPAQDRGWAHVLLVKEATQE